MDYNEEIIKLLNKQIEILEKIYAVFSKYDDEFSQSEQYLTEVAKDGHKNPSG
jgi:hypothetical protein